jgi:hypothetical protein
VVEQNITGSSESPLQSTIARVAQKIEVAVGGFFALVGADLGDDDLHLVGPLGVQPDLRLRRRREDVARTRGGFVSISTLSSPTPSGADQGPRCVGASRSRTCHSSDFSIAHEWVSSTRMSRVMRGSTVLRLSRINSMLCRWMT